MKLIGAVLAVAAVGSAGLLLARRPASGSPPQDASAPVRPVLVELFTSEGCSSCPPADALLAKLDREQRLGNAEIVALEEHVDYWDHLGWRDPFSSAQWTERQQDYAAAFRNDGVYTPQMVVDGRTEFVGGSQSRARSAIEDAAKEPKADVSVRVDAATGAAKVSIDIKMSPAVSSRNAQVWLAVTESGLHSNVQRGENAGEDLHHAAVVRTLRKVGNAAADRENAFAGEQEVRLNDSWKKENLRVVVFLQDAKSRHILGVASAHL